MPVARNQVEISWVCATPSIAVSTNPVTHIITLSTIASKDDTLDRPLVDKKTDHPFVRELEQAMSLSVSHT
jgi:hypothetical protein